MNPFEFVLAVLFMVFAFSVIRHRMGIPDRRRGQGLVVREDSAETLRLREEVQQLKERIKVLERITVDKENSVARQIEELRDR